MLWLHAADGELGLISAFFKFRSDPYSDHMTSVKMARAFQTVAMRSLQD